MELLHLWWHQKKNEVNVVSQLIAANANINKVDKNGKNALHHHLTPTIGENYYYANNGVFFDLIKNEIDVNAVDSDGKTPLFYAVQSSNMICVKELSHNFAKAAFIDKRGRTVLHYSCEKQDMNITEQILKWADLDVNVKDNNGKTASELTINPHLQSQITKRAKTIIKNIIAQHWESDTTSSSGDEDAEMDVDVLSASDNEGAVEGEIKAEDNKIKEKTKTPKKIKEIPKKERTASVSKTPKRLAAQKAQKNMGEMSDNSDEDALKSKKLSHKRKRTAKKIEDEIENGEEKEAENGNEEKEAENEDSENNNNDEENKDEDEHSELGDDGKESDSEDDSSKKGTKSN